MAEPSAPACPPVPWRTIWATISSVAAVYLGYQAFLAVGRVITYLVVALFFAIVLTPPVDFLQHKARVRRGVATLLVVLAGMGLFAGMIYVFVKPIAEQANTFSRDLPQYVQDARDGKGPIGDLVKRYNLEQKVQDNQAKIQEAVTNFGKNGLDIVQRIFSTIVAAITVFVLTILILVEGPSLSSAALNLVGEQRRERVQRGPVDAARAVSGYVFGNLLISLISGVGIWIVLLILGVPYAATLGLFVGAFADLIPLVGATLGAVPTVLFAFLHSVPAGIITIVYFIVYQQFENHVLQVTIMARTVRLNPLAVLVSVLMGVELFGFLGALLAIPAGGIIHVIARDIYDESRGRFKTEPTIGADEVPLSATTDDSNS